MKCAICDSDATYSWTDTHGVAQCWTCGTPYLIYHYESEGSERKRVDKAPELLVRDDYVRLLRDYWSESHRRIPGGHSFPGGQELATVDDHRAFNDWWMDKHVTEPKT